MMIASITKLTICIGNYTVREVLTGSLRKRRF